MSAFDPNDLARPNGNIFGFPVSEEEASIVLLPVPWDVTASYGKGTSRGPQAILDASVQLDFYRPDLENAHEMKVYMAPVSGEWLAINDELCENMGDYISFLEEGGQIQNNSFFASWLDQVNQTHWGLTNNLKERVSDLLEKGKCVGVIGGEHSSPLGLLEALNDKYESFGILHLDAHADLRKAYEGFEQSHASIFHNALSRCKNVEKLVSVGLRDISQGEVDMINESNERVVAYYDWDIKRRFYEGETWKRVALEIISHLPDHVYLSFDIDSLQPFLCPNTGTPVPGGFDFEQIQYLFKLLSESGKKLIGFDLCEVSPADNDQEWNANVGARVLWEILCMLEKQERSI